MIYWKAHDPRFEVRLTNPQGFGYDVWSWEGGQGWVDHMDLEDYLGFSEPFDPNVVGEEARIRLNDGIRYPQSLVLYTQEEAGVRISLIGTTVEQLFYGLSTVPPDWWIEDPLPLQRMVERVRLFIEGLSNMPLRQRVSPRGLQNLQTKVPGYCSACGLLDEYHVSHDVPGFPLSSLTTPEAARPYYQAFKAHYGNALRRMTEAELLAMPLPPSKRHLKILEMDIKRRLSEPPPVPASAIERLLTSDLLG